MIYKYSHQGLELGYMYHMTFVVTLEIFFFVTADICYYFNLVSENSFDGQIV